MAVKPLQAGGVALTSQDQADIREQIGLQNVNNTSDTTKAATGNPVGDAIAAKYTKPGAGIPATDLATAVQTSLGKADSAVQDIGTSTAALTAKTTPVDADTLPLSDSAATGAGKKLSWLNIKATLKTYFDTLYQAVLVSGTTIKTINGTSVLGSGDLTISGGGTTVENVLTSTSTTNALSAAQGKALKDTADALAITVAAKADTSAVTTGDTNTLNAAKSYADGLVVGLLDDRGNYNASGNVFPSSGGSGTAGAILKGDLWTISVAGTLGGVAVTAGDVVRAIVDTPGQTAANWAISETNIGYAAEPAQTFASQAEAEAGSGTGIRSWTPQRIWQAINARLTLGTWISGAAEDTTPQDADNLPLSDSTASNALKRITWATIKTFFAGRGAVGSTGITMSTARLLGRSTAGTGAVEEITVGTGLSLSGGTLTATGGGGGSGTRTWGVFTPMTAQPPASNFATLDTSNSIAVLSHAASVLSGSTWVWSVPEGANVGSGVSVRITWRAGSATSGNVRWRVSFMALTGAIGSDSYDTATEASSAANGTLGNTTTVAITCTTIASITAGSAFRIRIERVGTDGVNDTMTGAALLVGFEVRQVA